MRLAKGVCCIAIVIILVAIFTAKPSITYNSGAREQLEASLRQIRNELRAAKNERDVRLLLQPGDVWETPTRREQERWVTTYGVRLNWHNGTNYTETLFFPVSLVARPGIGAGGDEPRRPQWAMVPIDDADIEFLPGLLGCDEQAPGDDWLRCNAKRVEFLFTSKAIEDATVLMSDGSIQHVRVENLFSSGVKP